MIRVILHGCNGRMGQVITNLAAQDSVRNAYPVFGSLAECDVEADVVVDFASAAAVDALLDACVLWGLPCVVCTTGLSQAQLAHVQEAAKQVAILRSANMSLGINLLMNLLKEATPVLISRWWKSITIRSWTRPAARPLRWRTR